MCCSEVFLGACRIGESAIWKKMFRELISIAIPFSSLDNRGVCLDVCTIDNPHSQENKRLINVQAPYLMILESVHGIDKPCDVCSIVLGFDCG